MKNQLIIALSSILILPLSLGYASTKALTVKFINNSNQTAYLLFESHNCYGLNLKLGIFSTICHDEIVKPGGQYTYKFDAGKTHRSVEAVNQEYTSIRAHSNKFDSKAKGSYTCSVTGSVGFYGKGKLSINCSKD